MSTPAVPVPRGSSAPAGYPAWIQEVSRRYRRSQIKAAVAVNSEMLKFYFALGRDIVRMEADQPWGSGFFKRLSLDLKMQMPEAGCFSPRNLQYMRLFFKLYAEQPIAQQAVARLEAGGKGGAEPSPGQRSDGEIPQQAVAQTALQPVLWHTEGKTLVSNFEEVYPNAAKLIFSVPWGHHVVLMDKFKAFPEIALFYANETVRNGWSRAVLMHFMDTQLHLRQGKAVSNFATALPEPDSDLAQEVTKDPYCFDFAALTPKYREKELKDAMMAHVERFLLELGQGFMLVGREYRLEVGSKEVFADLLFFHMNLNRYVVVEVKVVEFAPAHLGQLGLYISAVNHTLKKPAHEPTIGMLLCKTKDNTMVKWALESTQHPIGVSEYRISEILPREVESNLPTIAEIESSFSGSGGAESEDSRP